ncbi:MAG: hypothetical protein H6Q69_2403 [Firmicutes bacterium]|nr:hypothetical protein [Bacillota bacterium]
MKNYFNQVLNEKGRPQRDKLVEAFINTNLYRSDGKNLWEYQDQYRYWEVISYHVNQRLKKKMPEELRISVSSSMLQGVVEDLIENPDLFVDFNAFRNRDVLNLKTRAYNLVTQQEVEMDKGCYCTYYLNFTLKDLGTVSIDDAPNFKGFVQSSLEYESDPTKCKLLLQIFAYVISECVGAKKMFCFIGLPHSGKSLLLHLLEYVIGTKQRSIIGMHELGQRFKLVGLLNARVNLSHEIRNANINCLDILKKLASNDEILVESKGKDAVEIKPLTKLVFAGNALPNLGEADNQGIVTRLIILLFSHSTPRDNWDMQLLEKLISEVDVIFSLAVKELLALIKNNFSFIQPKDSLEFLETYEQSQNSIQLFVVENCRFDSNEKSHYKELLEAYRKFCIENAFKPLIDSSVKQYIGAMPGVENKKINKNGKSLWGFSGIGI